MHRSGGDEGVRVHVRGGRIVAAATRAAGGVAHRGARHSR